MVINSQLAPCQQSYRITLDLTVDEDFNPRQIDFNKVFNLSEWESINTHIEEFQKPSTLHFTGPASSVFLAFFIKRYWRAVHYTLRATVLVNQLAIRSWPSKVFPQCKERIKTHTLIQVLIKPLDWLEQASYKTSKNWESLEV